MDGVIFNKLDELFSARKLCVCHARCRSMIKPNRIENERERERERCSREEERRDRLQFRCRIKDKIIDLSVEQRERNFSAAKSEKGRGVGGGGVGRTPLAKVIRNRCWHCSIMYSRALRVALHNARNLRLISILKHLRLCAYWRGCAREAAGNDAAIPTRTIICWDITRMPTIFATAFRAVSFELHACPFTSDRFFEPSSPVSLCVSLARPDTTVSRMIKQRRVDHTLPSIFWFSRSRRNSVNS